MKLLVTGATGFIGGAWLPTLSKGFEVVTLGRKPLELGIVHIDCDLSVPGALTQALSRPNTPQDFDAIVHLAVSPFHREFPEKAADLFEVNVATTAALLDFGRKTGIKHFILGSTGSVYDGVATAINEAEVGEQKRLNENCMLNPTRFFPATKFAAELFARGYEPFFSTTVLRFFAPYGPGQTGRLIPDLVDRVLSKKAVALPLSGPGIVMGAIFVDDCAHILTRALEEKWAGTFNCAHPEPLSIEALATLIGSLAGKQPLFERRGDIPSYFMLPDTAKLIDKLGASPMTDIATGLAQSFFRW